MKGRREWLGLLGRHQLASIVSTAFDFGAMAFLVQLASVPPSIAAIGGASLRAIVNFLLGRRYTFRAHGGPRHRPPHLSCHLNRWTIDRGADH